MATRSLSEPSVASSLVEVVTRLEDTLYPLGWEQPVALIAVESSRDIEMHMAPPLDDPIGDLVGLVAPEHWAAVGMMATGRVHDMGIEGARVYAVRVEPERRARMGHFVDRSGLAVSLLRLGDDAPEVTTGGPRGDRIDDVSRRCFGLPTAPAEVPLSMLWASCWLERVLDAAATSPTHVANWARVARHHVAIPATHPGPTVEGFVDAGRALAEIGSWETLRSLVAEGRQLLAHIDPTAARWMDEGMFARWVMHDVAPLGHLRDAVGEVVPAEVAAAVDEALGAWGLP